MKESANPMSYVLRSFLLCFVQKWHRTIAFSIISSLTSLMLPRTPTPLTSFKPKKRGLCDLAAFHKKYVYDLTFAVDNSDWIRAGLVFPALVISVPHSFPYLFY